jgi:hypothetical protein
MGRKHPKADQTWLFGRIRLDTPITRARQASKNRAEMAQAEKDAARMEKERDKHEPGSPEWHRKDKTIRRFRKGHGI